MVSERRFGIGSVLALSAMMLAGVACQDIGGGTQDKPKPDAPQPAETPQPPTVPPPAAKPKPVIYGAAEWATCPQLGKGCGALLVDFSKNNTTDSNLTDLAAALKKAGCSVDHLTPTFQDNPNKDATKTAANAAEWTKLRANIAAHTARGKELEIVVVKGHGADTTRVPGKPPYVCG